ncbi:MAG TPA: helix-turn-helix domain-containing protein [Solirubrobacterales bacterium]|nr:helix-turn-helix domain-containing protein [Solirubrobacterales bacterium]
MSRREYDQACSLASALDHVGERWSLLIVRELSLGPLRFSTLAREVGGAPTDVLTKRLRALEGAGVVRRRELPAPISATAYELTGRGRRLERPMIELGRWGMELQTLADFAGMEPKSLPNGLRVLIDAPPGFEATIGLRSRGEEFGVRFEDGWGRVARGIPTDPDLVLEGEPMPLIAALVLGGEAEDQIEIEGDRRLLERLREMVVLPDRLREEARTGLAAGALAA